MTNPFEYVDSRTVRGRDGGRTFDVLEAIAALRWTKMTCPSMPHEYTRRPPGSEYTPYDVVEAMLRAKNPDSYLAWFRGSSSPSRYWEASDGLRYWTGPRFMLNRCDPASVEPMRRSGRGVKQIPWPTMRYAPYDTDFYERVDGKSRPTAAAVAAGYLPCPSCQRLLSKPAKPGIVEPYPERVGSSGRSTA